ncbi:glycosyltransferase [Qipengyuania sp. S6317L1]|uniref:glycosyltransferase n=1 Tax=Qipengyuania sp. S6317L1 TaxID=2926410 RepID=UPI001FF2F87B|nr:glycosyltransferase [Qipengyuania sp. S6317L1]MCK0098764.1 glycosyltransferase [Qipengyuania sp. S6317L1]
MNVSAQCLVWLPHSYTARGPAESCVRIIEQFPAAGIETTLFVNRARHPIPDGVHLVEGAGSVLRNAPYRLVARAAKWRLERLFRKAVENAPAGTIAYFWPNTPGELFEYAKSRRLICVREMINSPVGNAKPILDKAYRDAGLDPVHGITDAMVDTENKQLDRADFVFSSNAQVDAALKVLGVNEDRLLPSSFGWVKSRFSGNAELSPEPGNSGDRPKFRAVFVGTMNVRKGVVTLLEAWEKASIDGELVLAGAVEPCLEPLVQQYSAKPGVTHLGHVSDVASLYRSCDAFVFPTHEEGGPQVTYEAAACGIPVVTTPMGAARLVRDGETGLLVEAGDVDGLAKALQRLADEQGLGEKLAKQALAEVDRFEYTNVGRGRATQLLEVCSSN